MRSLLIAAAAWLAIAAPAAARPLVVILADAEGTETTDLIAPYAILAESGAVEVKVVAASTAPVKLMPGRASILPQMTLDQLARRPKAADVVIVPAMHRVHDPQRAAWLQAQARNGARVMSICDGALVLADAGLLDGRQATVHWFNFPGIERKYPKVTWRRDARWVTDGPVTTTAGVSASAPASLALLRDLAGDEVMRDTARRLGLAAPDPRHVGADYRLASGPLGVAAGNTLAFWRRDDVRVPLASGIDELSFATVLDGWSRTYRSTAWAVGPARVVSRRGLTIQSAQDAPKRFDRQANLPAAGAMEAMFGQVRAAYGEPTARFVALQLEHPYGALSAW
jgi:putative intracellular protease/amidase